MGEAMLVRKGGTVLRGLEIISPPNKLSYYTGQHLDMDGTIVGAQFGSFVIPLHETAWTYAPTRALTEADTELIITATIGRLTKTANIPITVEAFSQVLNNNTWEQIAMAAADGIASSLWHVGDIKYETINGVNIGCRIIGFDADPLHSTDAKYNDTTYNANKKKAAITFQYIVSPSTYYINYSGYNTGGWLQCDMRTTRMQYELGLCPSDMRSVLRTVSKYTSPGGYGSTLSDKVDEAADEMFLLAAQEVFGPISSGTIGRKEMDMTTQYAWYAEGHDVRKESNKTEWLRSSHDPAVCSSRSDWGVVNTSGTLNIYQNPYSNVNYYPAFCI